MKPERSPPPPSIFPSRQYFEQIPDLSAQATACMKLELRIQIPVTYTGPHSEQGTGNAQVARVSRWIPIRKRTGQHRGPRIIGPVVREELIAESNRSIPGVEHIAGHDTIGSQTGPSTGLRGSTSTVPTIFTVKS